MHLDEFKKDLKKHVIEYQKRGLPHAHILLWLSNESMLRTPEDIDTLISAEIPDPVANPDLHDIVTKCMVHGPCGTANPGAPCMADGMCTKEFPKAFQEETVLNSDGYPLYRRPNNGRNIEKGGVILDNRWVVPYCPFLSLKYNAHINVEACTSIKSVKYIFKYVYKGYDCANIERTEVDGGNNEIKTYLDSRYVSATEAMWRLSEYKMSDKSHTVIRLDVHLPLEHNVSFRGREP